MDDDALLAHLKMTGRFTFVDDENEPTKHDRAIFTFSGAEDVATSGEIQHGAGVRVVWADMRQFGYVRIMSD